MNTPFWFFVSCILFIQIKCVKSEWSFCQTNDVSPEFFDLMHQPKLLVELYEKYQKQRFDTSTDIDCILQLLHRYAQIKTQEQTRLNVLTM
jgi:hypothetical protein